jgi:hypothetical protein
VKTAPLQSFSWVLGEVEIVCLYGLVLLFCGTPANTIKNSLTSASLLAFLYSSTNGCVWDFVLYLKFSKLDSFLITEGSILISIADPNPDPDPRVFGPPGSGS